MPFTWVFIVDEAHSGDVLDRKCTSPSISVVVHHDQHFKIRFFTLFLLDELLQCIVVAHLVSERGMRHQHLCHAYRASPAQIRGVAYFDLSPLRSVQAWQCQECLNLLVIGLEKRSEVLPVAEPEQRQERLLEGVFSLFNCCLLLFWCLLYRRIAIVEFLMQKHNGQIALFADADELFRAEYLAHVAEESSSFFLVHHF